ncbi:DUF6527 family protein [Desulfosediminicola ganghwensis]|uniref:DUF6527 family protein n=1 Tax=Desulfosediminicola ganghwensis TaxID=2569540 RepID=UPI002680D1BC
MGIRRNRIAHRFVETVPEQIDDGTLYISQRYKTAVHKCCCGCGEEVVTPLNPADWSLQLAGGKVTLYPSIGNWSYKCRSHYWIERNQVIWAGSMSQRKVERNRARDRYRRELFFDEVNRRKVDYDLPPKKSTQHDCANLPSYVKKAWKAVYDFTAKFISKFII